MKACDVEPSIEVDSFYYNQIATVPFETTWLLELSGSRND